MASSGPPSWTGKGLHDEGVVRRPAELFQNLGVLQIACRSDQEAAITAMRGAACRLSGRKSLPITDEQEGEAVEALRQDDALAARDVLPGPSSSASGAPSPTMVEDSLPPSGSQNL